MILNCSRAKVFHTCKRKVFNNYHRRLEGARSMNLVDGSAFHEAVAHGLATPADHDWSRALVESRKKFDEGVAASGLLDFETWKIDMHWQIVEKMVELYRDNYGKEPFQIIQPEVNFDVELPGTHHNCIFVHHLEFVPDTGWNVHSGPGFKTGTWVEKWGHIDPQAILEHRVRSPHPPEFITSTSVAPMECACWQPHRLVGKTDALMRWQNNIWLMEHKTSAIKGDQFWDQWELDVQPTTYMYGIWKALNFRPRGFVLDMIYKPSERQVEGWNGKRKYGPAKGILDYMDYERRAFLRSEQDLQRLERWYIDTMNEWESRIAGPLAGQWPMANVGHACKMYNRRCDYWSACVGHDEPRELAMPLRKPDYVDDKLVQLLPAGHAAIPVPVVVERQLPEGWEVEE